MLGDEASVSQSGRLHGDTELCSFDMSELMVCSLRYDMNSTDCPQCGVMHYRIISVLALSTRRERRLRPEPPQRYSGPGS